MMQKLEPIMVLISRAVREALQQYGRTLGDIPTDVLEDAERILSGYREDVAAELRRRRN